jgi:signal transduction histidine kinase
MKFTICLLAIVLNSIIVFSQKDITGLLSDLKKATSASEKIDAYRDIFKYYEFTKPDSANYYIGNAIKEFTFSGNDTGVAAMTVIRAYLDVDQGRFALARENHMKALAMFESTGYKRGIASAHNGLGILDGREGNFSGATKHFLTALKLFESTNDIDGIVNTYQKLGTVNDVSNNLDKALEYYFAAIKQMEMRPVEGTHKAWLFNNIGIVYGKTGELNKALGYFTQALAGSKSPEFTDLRILTLNNLGILYDKFDSNAKALECFDEAIKITKDKNLPENYARLCVSRASVISKTDPAAAIKTLEEALVTVKSLGLKSLEADIYDSMVETYDRLGNYKEAMAKMGLLRRLEDSLEGVEKSKELMNMQATYELSKSKAELSLANEKNETNKVTRYFVIGIAILLSVVLLLLAILFKRSSRLNDELKKREAELSKSNEIKDRLFSVIGHDLRGPIGNVPAVLEILDNPGTTADERKYLMDTLTMHSKASMETLDKLLYWGNAQIKGIGINQMEFAAGKHIENNMQLSKTSAEQKHIMLSNKVPDGLSIFADPSHFDFVLRNLVSNAIKFTNPHGSITISADTKSKPDYIVFAVKDTGVGIPASKIKDIFNPFGYTTRGTADEKGTGIGLMLCKEFVTENGGEIWVETEEGKGTTFYFSLKKGKA